MGNLFEIIEGKTIEQVKNRLIDFSTSRKVLRELGESLVVESNQKWFFAISHDFTIGFLAYKDNKILYAFVKPSYRKIGIFSELYAKLPKKEWKVNSSISAIPVYEKLGFEVIKRYNVCAKMKLKNAKITR